MAVISSTIIAAAAIASTVGTIAMSEKAASAQKKQYRAERKKAEIENVYKARQSIRQARLAQSAMVNQAALSGGIGGSGLAGGLASVGSQLGGNLNYMSEIAEQNTAIGNAAIQTAGYQAKGAIYGQVGQMAGTIFSGMTGQTPGQYVGSKLKGGG